MMTIKILVVVAATTIALVNVPGCASIATYQASHPYYRFPGGGYGGGGANS